MIVLWLFLSVPWVCLQFVIVIFPNHTHYFWVSFMQTAMALASLHICLVSSEPSSQFKILMWWLKWRLNANLCEHGRLWQVCTFAQAYLSHRHCTKSLVLPKMAICVLFTPAVNTLVSLHICAKSLDNAISIKIFCAGSEGSCKSARLHRLA